VNKGESIVDGPADPHDILRLQGMEALARYITDEVQDVYRLQGVKINDKHIEVIVRQMLRRVSIVDNGDTRFIPGEQVERADVLGENDRVLKEGKETRELPLHAVGYHEGVTLHRFLHFRSLVPGNHARSYGGRHHGQAGRLRGLKENVIVGRLIPAGTGWLSPRPKEDFTTPVAIQWNQLRI